MHADNKDEDSLELNQQTVSQADNISIPIFRCSKLHQLD